jgi:hypothetical protein
MPNDESSQSQWSGHQIASEGLAGEGVHFTEVARGSWEDVSGGAHPAVITALERIAPELAAMRELKEVHGLLRSLAGLDGLDAITASSLRDSLTGRSGGLRVGGRGESGQLEGPLGKIPGRSGGGGGHVRYRPDTNLRTGGLARQGGGPTNIGPQVGGAYGTISRGSDGTTVVTRTEKYESGTTITTVVTYGGGKVTRTDWWISDPDGSSSSGGTVNQDDGSQVEYEIDTDANGDVTSERYETRDVDGNPVKADDLAGQPGADGEGHDSDLARHFRAWHAAVYGPDILELEVPALVNPGTPENADSAHAPTGGINLGDSIVINPDPERAGGPGGGLSSEAAHRMKERLKDVGTPGPNPGPRPGE